MTVTIKEKRTKAGKTYLYLQIAFKDPLTGKWRHTDKATGLLVKGNRRQAEKLRKEAEEKYKYLEEPLYATDQLYPDMSVTDYFNYCLEKKEDPLQRIHTTHTEADLTVSTSILMKGIIFYRILPLKSLMTSGLMRSSTAKQVRKTAAADLYPQGASRVTKASYTRCLRMLLSTDLFPLILV